MAKMNFQQNGSGVIAWDDVQAKELLATGNCLASIGWHRVQAADLHHQEWPIWLVEVHEGLREGHRRHAQRQPLLQLAKDLLPCQEQGPGLYATGTTRA